jgi:hypothetical protein
MGEKGREYLGRGKTIKLLPKSGDKYSGLFGNVI